MADFFDAILPFDKALAKMQKFVCRGEYRMFYLITGGAGSGKSEYAEKLAVQEATVSGDRLFYVATMFPYDDAETKLRIERHRKLREGKGFITLEKPVDIEEVLVEIRRSEKETDDFFDNQLKEKIPTVISKEIFKKTSVDETGYIKPGKSSKALKASGDNNKSFSEKHSDNAIRTDAVVLLEDLTNLFANERYQTDGHPHAIAEPLRELASNVKALIVVSNELYSDGRKYPEETMEFLRNLAGLNREISEAADRVYEVVAGIPVRIK